MLTYIVSRLISFSWPLSSLRREMSLGCAITVLAGRTFYNQYERLLMFVNWYIIVNVSALRFHKYEAPLFLHFSFTRTQNLPSTTDFLAIESLLDIICILIPPIKNGVEKRSQFIKEVFHPDLFQCSKSILQILESITDGDWSITAVKIIEALASSDISLSAQSLFSELVA
jgi:hypothetical protein